MYSFIVNWRDSGFRNTFELNVCSDGFVLFGCCFSEVLTVCVVYCVCWLGTSDRTSELKRLGDGRKGKMRRRLRFPFNDSRLFMPFILCLKLQLCSREKAVLPLVFAYAWRRTWPASPGAGN